MGVGRATRKLVRTALANPMWALPGALLAPFRLARHILGIVSFSVLWGVDLPNDMISYQIRVMPSRGSEPSQGKLIATTAELQTVTLTLHFGFCPYR